MISRLRPALRFEELRAAWTPTKSTDIASFERAFATLIGQRHAVAFPYGRTGLSLLLEALGIHNKQVITPAWTCVVVPHAVVHSGNKPRFIDCAPDHYNMDLGKAESAIGPNTGAIIATSIFGHSVDLDALDAIRKRHPEIPVIQDCAHSFVCDWNGRAAPAAGVAAIFGLNISKLITSIFGGMVTTDDRELANKLRAVRDRRIRSAPLMKAWKRRIYLPVAHLSLWPPIYGLINRCERLGLLDRFVKYYDESTIDMPADWDVAMTPVEARVGIEQCLHYPKIIAHRRSIAAIYHQTLSDISGVRRPPMDSGATWSHYTILVDNRPRLLERALQQGIQLGSLIEYCIPHMAAYMPYSIGELFPHAGAYATKSVNLPLWIHQDQAHQIASIVRQITTNPH